MWDVVGDGIFSLSDLVIEPLEYQAKLIARWSDITFGPYGVSEYLLQWRLPPEQHYAGLWGGLQSSKQVITFETGPKRSFIDFVLWNRSIIPQRYDLYFSNSTTFVALLLTTQTKEDDILQFTGIVD